MRFFRKDGHEWQKKKDGKTVRETHEKLKVGNVELLNCYYAHHASDGTFQRRCYWLLNSDEGVVLVHYLKVTPGMKTERGGHGGDLSNWPAGAYPGHGFQNLFGGGDSGGTTDSGLYGTLSGTFSGTISGGGTSGGAFGSRGGYSDIEIDESDLMIRSAGSSPTVSQMRGAGGFGGRVGHAYASHQGGTSVYASSPAAAAARAAAQMQMHDARLGRPITNDPPANVDRWWSGRGVGTGDDDEYGVNDPELEELLRDSDMELGTPHGGAGAPGGGQGRPNELHQYLMNEIGYEGGGNAPPPPPPGSDNMRQKSWDSGLSLSVSGLTGLPSAPGEDSVHSGTIAGSLGVGAPGHGQAPPPHPLAAAAAEAAAAAGPDITTSFLSPTPAPSSSADDLSGRGADRSSAMRGVTSLTQIEGKIADLQQTLLRVASNAVHTNVEQVARLEEDLIALESGAEAMMPRAIGSGSGTGGGSGGGGPGRGSRKLFGRGGDGGAFWLH